MQSWIAFLRAIGGNYTLPSKTFIEILEALKMQDAKTYIATGNAVFRSRAANRDLIARRISDGINDARGFAPKVLLLTPEELGEAIANNPYRAAESEPTTLHLTFLSGKPADPDLPKLQNLRVNGEQFTLKDKIFYFHAPNGIGRSKLFSRIEKSLGTWGTARNWRTVCKVKELAGSIR